MRDGGWEPALAGEGLAWIPRVSCFAEPISEGVDGGLDCGVRASYVSV